MKRSDLICENGVINDKQKGNFVHNFTLYRTNCAEMIIDKSLSEKTGKPVGRYVTIFCDEGDFRKCFIELLSSFLLKGTVLVAGLGNERICSDSLGAASLRYIPATAHLSPHEAFKELSMRAVYVIEPGVMGKTGIESTAQIKCISDKVKPDLIIAIDSLACSDTDRLCRTIQITDAGIAPGAGVGNNRRALDYDSVGVKVIAVGVPTVIDYDENSGFMVTPRNIDTIIDEFSAVIGKGISSALNPTLSAEELLALTLL